MFIVVLLTILCSSCVGNNVRRPERCQMKYYRIMNLVCFVVQNRGISKKRNSPRVAFQYNTAGCFFNKYFIIYGSSE